MGGGQDLRLETVDVQVVVGDLRHRRHGEISEGLEIDALGFARRRGRRVVRGGPRDVRSYPQAHDDAGEDNPRPEEKPQSPDLPQAASR